jgi:hypothetical protein
LLIDDGVDGGREGESRAEYFVATADSGDDEGKMEGSGARVESSGMRTIDCFAELSFKVVNMRTDGGNPVSVKGFFNIGEFFVTHVGGREQDRGWVHGFT